GCSSCTNCNTEGTSAGRTGDGCLGDSYIDYYCSGTSCLYSTHTCDSRCYSCGDGKCDSSCGENNDNCPWDCSVCGNGECESTESVNTCPQDCCQSDCTATYDNTCHLECNGYNGCAMNPLCNGYYRNDEICSSNWESLATCCEGGFENCSYILGDGNTYGYYECCNDNRGIVYHNFYCTGSGGDSYCVESYTGSQAECNTADECCQNCDDTNTSCYCSNGLCQSCSPSEACSNYTCSSISSCDDIDISAKRFFEAIPGVENEMYLTLNNKNDVPYSVHIYIENKYEYGTWNYSFENVTCMNFREYIDSDGFKESVQDIPSNGSCEIKFKFTPPKDVTAGSSYRMIINIKDCSSV
ncbi:MAG: hypothetical protein J7K87_00745, partial [Candidatus Aenigmarchaeota archaeon]|nr:hypothetical protein [Candidatus Aenigmarchaeota archaeon]